MPQRPSYPSINDIKQHHWTGIVGGSKGRVCCRVRAPEHFVEEIQQLIMLGSGGLLLGTQLLGFPGVPFQHC